MHVETRRLVVHFYCARIVPGYYYLIDPLHALYDGPSSTVLNRRMGAIQWSLDELHYPRFGWVNDSSSARVQIIHCLSETLTIKGSWCTTNQS